QGGGHGSDGAAGEGGYEVPLVGEGGRRGGSQHHVADEPAPDARHYGEDEDAEQVEAVLDGAERARHGKHERTGEVEGGEHGGRRWEEATRPGERSPRAARAPSACVTVTSASTDGAGLALVF